MAPRAICAQAASGTWARAFYDLFSVLVVKFYFTRAFAGILAERAFFASKFDFDIAREICRILAFAYRSVLLAFFAFSAWAMRVCKVCRIKFGRNSGGKVVFAGILAAPKLFAATAVAARTSSLDGIKFDKNTVFAIYRIFGFTDILIKHAALSCIFFRDTTRKIYQIYDFALTASAACVQMSFGAKFNQNIICAFFRICASISIFAAQTSFALAVEAMRACVARGVGEPKAVNFNFLSVLAVCASLICKIRKIRAALNVTAFVSAARFRRICLSSGVKFDCDTARKIYRIYSIKSASIKIKSANKAASCTN